MSRKKLPLRLESDLPSSPRNGMRLCGFSPSQDSWYFPDGAFRFRTQTSRAVVRCQPWFYRRLVAYSFFWLSEGAYGLSRDSECSKHPLRLTRYWMLTLEPKRPKNRPPSLEMNPEIVGIPSRRSSCLLLQMFSVETRSFLPDHQSDGGDLAGQSQTRHRWFHSASY